MKKVPYLVWEITEAEYEELCIPFEELYKDVGSEFLLSFATREGLGSKILTARVEPQIQLLEKYYTALEAGVADFCEPDYTQPVPTKEEVNTFIEKIDDFFAYELKCNPDYWKEKEVDKAPEFARLGGKARLCLFQQWYARKAEMLAKLSDVKQGIEGIG